MSLSCLRRPSLRFSLLLLCGISLSGYSVLTHEAIIDGVWDQNIKPLLLQRFPQTTPEQLLEAHSYAYGGCIIQDMGYYPFGNKMFSDLTHYVRTGDFVEALISEAQDVNEYAFALGSLAHYSADNSGHPNAVNKTVPVLFPKLRRKFGDTVTYEDNPVAHIKTEFGFDVVQVAQGLYAPQAYHDFIGFHVAKPLLERSFEKTYGIKLKDVFTALDLALGSYRRSVSNIIPEMTRAAWSAKKKEIEQKSPGMTRRKFLYTLQRSSYEKEWGRDYKKPGFGARLIAFIFRIIPKIGPFKALGFRTPTPATELLFQKSFEETIARYKQYLSQVANGTLKLEDRNFDTGGLSRAGEYALADTTYAKLLDKLAKNKFQEMSPELRANIVAYYNGAAAMTPGVQVELDALKATQ